MAAKGPAKGDRSKTLDDALLRVVSNFENVYDLSFRIWDRYFRTFAHRARKMSYLSTCDSARKRVAKAL